jgi:hypothetical protein
MIFLQLPKPGHTFLFAYPLDLDNPFGFAVGFKSWPGTLKDTKCFSDQLIWAEFVLFHVRQPISVML